MEKLAESGLLQGVIDVTTTEVCDLLMGGVFPCTEDRFGAIARTGLPYVGSCGALDMVNFGAMETVPMTYQGPQPLRSQSSGHAHAHDAGGECAHRDSGSARSSTAATARSGSCCREGGVSLLDAPGLAFHDPAADSALFAPWRGRCVRRTAPALIRLPYAINDPPSRTRLLTHFHAVLEET